MPSEGRKGRGAARGAGGPARAEGLDRLLREMRRQTARGAEPDTARVLDWLHRQSGAHVAVVAGDADTVVSSTAGVPRQVLSSLAPLLARIAGGQLAAGATEAGGLHVRCEALGSHEPRPVLVVASRSEPDPETAALTSHVGSVLALLRRAESSERLRRGYQQKARQVRFAVLHALLAGEPLLARRMTTGAVPPLLDAERLRVHLLRCPSADRDRIAQAYQDPAGYHGPALMVHCPVFNNHLICLVADDGRAPGDGPAPGSGREQHTVGGILRGLVRDNPHYALGVSGAHPLGATAEAYSQAAHALAAARSTPGRVAYHHGRTPLDGVLPGGPARAWARALLRPLDSAPKACADVIRLALTMPRSGVARILGLSRNTVAAHLVRGGQALGLDLTDVRSRAAVQLALALGGSRADAEPEGHQRPPDLDDLLSAERAAAWARALLRPLDTRHRHTLEAWIDAGADAQRAARHLAISRNTVRAHLRTAETALGLDLLTTGAGVHDVVHALDIDHAHAHAA